MSVINNIEVAKRDLRIEMLETLAPINERISKNHSDNNSLAEKINKMDNDICTRLRVIENQLQNISWRIIGISAGVSSLTGIIGFIVGYALKK